MSAATTNPNFRRFRVDSRPWAKPPTWAHYSIKPSDYEMARASQGGNVLLTDTHTGETWTWEGGVLYSYSPDTKPTHKYQGAPMKHLPSPTDLQRAVIKATIDSGASADTQKLFLDQARVLDLHGQSAQEYAQTIIDVAMAWPDACADGINAWLRKVGLEPPTPKDRYIGLVMLEVVSEAAVAKLPPSFRRVTTTMRKLVGPFASTQDADEWSRKTGIYGSYISSYTPYEVDEEGDNPDFWGDHDDWSNDFLGDLFTEDRVVEAP